MCYFSRKSACEFLVLIDQHVVCWWTHNGDFLKDELIVFCMAFFYSCRLGKFCTQTRFLKIVAEISRGLTTSAGPVYKGNLTMVITVTADVLLPNGVATYAVSALTTKLHIDGLVQDCSNSSALTMELLQSCTISHRYVSLSICNFVYPIIGWLVSFTKADEISGNIPALGVLIPVRRTSQSRGRHSWFARRVRDTKVTYNYYD